MNITEKTAYLKGLLAGLRIDEEKPEGKLISAIIDALDEMASEVADLKQENDRIYDYLDELDHDLGDVESELYELDDYYGEDEDDDYYDDEDEDEEEEDGGDAEEYKNPRRARARLVFYFAPIIFLAFSVSFSDGIHSVLPLSGRPR
ncbi:MAG: hypothetical protein IJU75_02080 [Clostridia bacterium]|nr:hypothetical protein [Clostridia bacterium]